MIVDLPTGMNSTNTRVLDVSVYFYVMMGDGVWFGLGYQYGDEVVGYTIHVPGNEGETGTMAITYPEIASNSYYCVLLIKVTNSVNPLE